MVVRLIVAVALMAAGLHEPAADDLQAPYMEKKEKEFAFYPGGKLEIGAALPGSIRIEGWRKASLRVEMERLTSDLPQDQTQAPAVPWPVHVTNTPTSARIIMDPVAAAGLSTQVNLVVYVPFEKTDLSIKMIKGILSIAALNGSIEATLEEGDVAVRDLAGYFSALTRSGNLYIELQGKRWTGYGLTGATRQGSISLRLPVDYSAALQLLTKNGTLSIDFPDQLVEGEYVPLKIAEKKKAQSLSAPIGSGGAPIRLSTFSGDITLQPLPR